MNETIQIPLTKLQPALENVRTVSVSEQEEQELKASIQAHGLLYPLQVKAADNKDHYNVIDGCRRLSALRALKPKTVTCLVLGKDQSAREISLVGNVIRTAMHPADQFSTFKQLIEDGFSEEQISQRFGISAKTVVKHLKLGKLAPKIIDAYRKGKITLETCMAFTLTDDHNLQKSILGTGDHVTSHHVRSQINNNTLPCNRGIGKFIAQDYIAAGHPVNRDLFSDDASGELIYLTDIGAAHSLAQAKLQKEADRLVEKEGWKWAKVECEFSYELDRLYGHLHKAPGKPWPAKVKSQSGCIVTVGYDGRPSIIEGKITKEDLRARNREAKKANKEQKTESEAKYSQPHANDLRRTRTAIVREHLAKNPEVALDLLLYSLVMAFDNPFANPTFLSMAWDAHQFKPEDLPKDFKEIEALSSQKRNSLLAQVIAACLKGQLACDAPNNPVFERATQRLGIDFASHYRPTADDYWGKLTRSQILNIGEELLGAHWAKKFETAKKSTLVKEIAALFTVGSPPQGINPKVFAKISKWLPVGFRAFDDGKSVKKAS